jgi:hypothetical protein
VKRSPLRRKTPLEGRSELRRGRRLPQRSKATARSTDERDEIRQAVFDRDRVCLLRGVAGAGPCFGPLTPHHRRKSGAAGAYSMDNLRALCAGHNDGIEADAELSALATALNLVVREGHPEWESLGRRGDRSRCSNCK